jgi:hypothetical protein
MPDGRSGGVWRRAIHFVAALACGGTGGWQGLNHTAAELGFHTVPAHNFESCKVTATHGKPLLLHQLPNPPPARLSQPAQAARVTITRRMPKAL